MSLTIDTSFVREYATKSREEALSDLRKLHTPSSLSYIESPSYFQRSRSFQEQPRSLLNLNYTDNSWNWGSRNVSYGDRIRASSTDLGNIIGCGLGALLLLAGAGTSGYLYNLWQGEISALKETEMVHRCVRSGRWDHHISSKTRQDFEKLVDLKLSINQIRASYINNYFLSAIGGITGVVSYALGLVTLAPWFIMAGQISLIGSVVLAAWNFGSHLQDKSRLERCYKLISGDSFSGNSGLADQVLSDTRTSLNPLSYFPAQREEPVLGTVIPQRTGKEPSLYATAPPSS